MAGPSIGTWVKVKNKSGRMTARVLAKKFGGGEYEQGQVITQSEYQSFQKKRAEAIAQDSKGKKKDDSLPSKFSLSDYADPFLLDTVAITSNKKSKMSSAEVDKMADALLAGGGIVNPLIVRQTGNDKYEVVEGHAQFQAIQRAKEKNKSFELTRAIVLNYNDGTKKNLGRLNDEAVMEQASLLKRFPREVPPGAASAKPKPKTSGYDLNDYNDYSLVDIVSVKTPAKKGDVPDRDVEALARSYLKGNGNIRPFILRRTGPEDFEVVAGQKEFLAAQRAKELVPSFEMVRGVILNSKNTEGIMYQLGNSR